MQASLKKHIGKIPILRTALQLLHRVWKMRTSLHAIVLDLKRTYTSTKFLREKPHLLTNKTLLLLVLNDDSIYPLKLFSLLAVAFKLRGWDVKVVLRNRSKFIGQLYMRAFGINHFVYLEDQPLNPEDRAYCKKAAQDMLQGSLDIQTIKTWTFEGSWIGPQIIATLSRLQFQGMPDFKDPTVHALLMEVLPVTLEHALRAAKFIRKQNGTLALANEANYASFGPLVDMSIHYGVPVIQYIQTWQDDGVVFRRLTHATRREHPASVAKETLNKMVQNPWTEREEHILNELFANRYGGKWFLQSRNQKSTRSYTRKELIEKFKLDQDKKIAVVFSHVLWDANLFYGDDIFKDYGDWFIQTIKAACANTSINWLIKLHPANVWKRAYENVTGEYAENVLIRNEIGDLPSHIKIVLPDSDISTLSLFEVIDYGVTARGTSGMELACFGKPCLTAGTGRYSGLGFTIDSDNAEEYLERLATLHSLAPMNSEEITRAKWHAYVAFILRSWTMKSARAEFAYKKTGNHPLDHNLHILLTSLESIQRADDLAAWYDWAAGSDIDYIAYENSTS